MSAVTWPQGIRWLGPDEQPAQQPYDLLTFEVDSDTCNIKVLDFQPSALCLMPQKG